MELKHPLQGDDAKRLLIPHPKQTFLIDQGTFLLSPDPASPLSTQPSSLPGRLHCYGHKTTGSTLLLNTIMPALKSLQGIMEMIGEDSITLQGPWLGHPFIWEVSCVLHSFQTFCPQPMRMD